MAKTPKTPVVDQRLLDALANHPEKITIDFGGKRDFLLNAYGAKVLRKLGHDPIPVVFDALRGLAPMFGQFQGKNATGSDVIVALMKTLDPKILEDLCVVIWWGLIAYDPDITLDEVEIHATAKAIYKCVTQVYQAMASFADDEDTQEESDGESGN